MTDWPIVRLGDHVDACLGKMLDAQKNRGSFQPYLGNSNVRWGAFDLNDLSSMRFEEGEEDRYGLQNGDLVICEGGEPGRCAIWRDQIPGMKIQKALHRVRVKARLDQEYLYYWFMNAGRSGRLEPYFTGTTIKHLTGRALSEVEIPCPSLNVQRSIGEILKTFDDKIELNRRTNETLEAMAQAIFRDWFVDFGPVRRKLAGVTDPVEIMDGVTIDATRAAELAALFPDRLDADVPGGWTVEPVFDQADWVNGAAYKKMHFVERGEGLPVIKIAELKAGITSTTGFTNTDLGARYRIDDGELLFSWSGNPDTSIDTFIWTGGPAWLNQHIFAVRSNGRRSCAFLFAMLKYLNPTFAELARDKQTTGLGHVTKEDLKRLQVVIPPRIVEIAFDALALPMMSRLQAALIENRTLAETRDYLLPRLMSGEVGVGEVTQEIAA